MGKKFSKNLKLNSDLAFSFFLVTRIAALVLSFPCITDVPQYLDHFIKGQIFNIPAYSGFAYEYPPLTLLIIYFPALVFKDVINFEIYFICFAVTMFLIDFLCLKSCQFYCQKRLKLDEDDINYMVIFYSLFGLLMFRMLYHRLDVVVALFFSLSLILFYSGNSKLKPLFFVNALAGFFYKVAPAFTVPSAIIIKAFSRNQNLKKTLKKIFLDSAIFVFLLALIIWIFETYSHGNFIKNMLFHQSRGIQIESTYGSFFLLLNLLTPLNFPVISNYGSWNIFVDNFYVTQIIKNFGNFVIICFYASLFTMLIYKRSHQHKITISEQDFLEITLVTILITLSFQKVLSAQFFIWLIPVVAIWLAKERSNFFSSAFSLLFFLTFAIFSFVYYPAGNGYISLINQTPIMVMILVLRNFLLLFLTFLISKRFFKNFLHDTEN